LDLFRPDSLNVLCIHAEVEGLARAALFEDFLARSRDRGLSFTRLDEVLDDQGPLPAASLVQRTVPGREGLLTCQAETKVA
jgi:undecaprenyl phosphate-alpha-L-ara4FN deformylase